METTEEPKQSLKEISDLGDELLKYVDTLKLEKETKDRIAGYINEVQSALSSPVKLNVGNLSKWFPGVDSAVLVDGVKLVLRRANKEKAVSVLELEPDPYVAVVKEAGSVVARLVEEAEKRRTEKIKPVLQVFMRLVGGKLGIFDWRSYNLVFANTGGAAKRLVLSVGVAGGEKIGPFDVNARENAEVELGGFRTLRSSRALKIEARCEDQEGRKYTGHVELEPNSKEVHLLKLSLAEAVPS